MNTFAYGFVFGVCLCVLLMSLDAALNSRKRRRR